MKYRVYKYDGFRVNLTHQVIPSSCEEVIFLAVDKDISEVEVLGIENVVKKVCQMCEGLNCNVKISLGMYIKQVDRIAIDSTKPQLFGSVLYQTRFSGLKECLKDYEQAILNENIHVICIEYQNEKRKNTWPENFLKPKKDIVETYGERDYFGT